jgi:hypothetical protein
MIAPFRRALAVLLAVLSAVLPAVLPAVLLVAATSCTTTPSWHVDRVLDAGEKLGGCAAGDVLPDRPGTELVAVAASGAVWVCWRESGVWKGEVVFRAPGEMIQVACGDVLKDVPGDEIVTVGMAQGTESDDGRGAVWLIHRAAGAWHAIAVAGTDRLVHGACVSPRHEIVFTGFDARVHFLDAAAISPTDPSPPTRSAGLPGAGKSVIWRAPTAPWSRPACRAAASRSRSSTSALPAAPASAPTGPALSPPTTMAPCR